MNYLFGDQTFRSHFPHFCIRERDLAEGGVRERAASLEATLRGSTTAMILEKKELFMTKQTVKNLALSLAVLGVALIPALSIAQARLGPKFPGKGAASSAARAASRRDTDAGRADL